MDDAAQTVPFFQGWTDTNQIDDFNIWDNVPGMVGYGEDVTFLETQRDPALITAPAPDGSLPNVFPNRSILENEVNMYGPIEFEFFNPTIGLRGSSSFKGPYIQVSLNTTGKINPLFLYFRVRDVDYLSSGIVGKLAVQYRIGNTGNFTNIPEGYVAEATSSVPFEATKVTAMVVPLPAAINDKALVQLRFITSDAEGTDQWIGIDDITIDEDLPPFVDTVTPADGQGGVPAVSPITLVLSENGVVLTDPLLTLNCGGNVVPTTFAQNGRTVTVNYTGALPAGALCTLEVDKTKVLDNTAKPMLENFSSQFTVSGCGSASTTKISEVQGTGEVSPKVGQVVTVEGIITNFPTFATTNPVGFYIQSASDSDSNPASSEGLFVEMANTLLSAFSLGQSVRLTGTVDEYTSATAGEMARMTRLTSVDFRSREVCTTGQTAPTATVNLSLVNTASYLERYEGMQVNVTGSQTIQQNEFLGRFGQMILGNGGRISNVNNGTGGLATDVNRMIVLDDGSAVQYPNPIPNYATNGANRAGDTVSGVTGILDQGRINGSTTALIGELVFPNVYYRVQKTANPSFTVTSRPAAAPAVNGTIKVASFNVDNYFISLGSLGAATAGELTRQTDKLVRAIAGIGADVIALQGVEALNSANAPTALRDAVNTYLATTNYEVVADPSTGTGPGLTQVTLLYNKTKVTPVGASLSKADASFTSYPVAQLFQVNANSQKFVVVGAHFASTNQSAQATALLSFINTNLKPLDPDVVVAGDLNTYVADGTIATLTAGGLTNQVVTSGPAFPYSYVENGAVGYRDFVLTTLAANRQVEKVDFWHINADEPAIIDYKVNTSLGLPKNPDLYANDRYRSAVHDPVLVGLTIVANQVPVGKPLSNQSVNQEATLNYSFPADTFTDPDSPKDQVVSYDAKLVGGANLPSWLTFNGATRTFSGTPHNADVGQITVEVRAFDYTGQVDPTVYGTTYLVITVININDPPVVNVPLPDKTVVINRVYSFQFAADSFTDADGNPLTYTATLSNDSALPSWVNFNSATRTFSGTPTSAQTITVKVTASDGTASVSDEFILTARLNVAPILAKSLVNQTVNEDSALNYIFDAGTFTDSDGDPLNYTATKNDGTDLPMWLALTSSTRTFSGTPANEDVGTIIVRVTASDGIDSASGTFTVTVLNTNDAPTVANQIPPQTAFIGQSYSFTFAESTFNDMDGNPLTYEATLEGGASLPAWLNFNATTRTFSATPTASNKGTYSITVTATDNAAVPLSASTTFTLVVQEQYYYLFLPSIRK
jgi:predicted extracellular nuclease